MKDIVYAVHSFSNETAIENGADDELASQARQIALKTAAQIIKDAHLRSILEVLGDMPTDETGASRNQDSHIGMKQSGAPIQRSARCKIEILTGRSIPRLLPKIVNLCEKFWRSEQSIVASSRYEREC
jgi:hypothetical protein